MTDYKETIQKESATGISEYSLSSEYIANRTIVLFGEINAKTANDFALKLLYLQQIDNTPIKVLINSNGGEVYAGLTIFDLIKGSPCRIEGYVTGIAASMAAIIFMGCEKGYRYMLPHSRTMIHEPLVNSIGGNTSSIKSFSDDMIKVRESLNKLMADCTGKTIKEINKATSYDNFMNAEESVEFGICDEIITTINI